MLPRVERAKKYIALGMIVSAEGRAMGLPERVLDINAVDLPVQAEDVARAQIADRVGVVARVEVERN